MKYCEEYAALLDLYVDGELPPDGMEQIWAHLEACPGCRAYVDDALAIRAGFPGVEETAVPEGFAAGVMERVRESAGKGAKTVEMKRRPVRRWTGTLAALAACCALVIILRTSGARGGGSAAGNVATSIGADSPAAYDTACADADAGDGIAPQMETAPQDSGEMAAEGGQVETRMMVEGRKDLTRDAAENVEACDVGNALQAALPAEAAPGTAAGDAGTEAALYLTAEETGDLLNGFAPVREDAVSASYELSAGEYRALLETLGRPVEPTGDEEARFLVVVTWALE